MASITKLEEIYDSLGHATSIYPGDTNLTCTFTAHANANTWSDWAEVTDSGANTMSALFVTNIGHITAMFLETLSELDTVYMMEMAYGAAKTLITSGRFAGETKFQVPPGNLRFWAPTIPAGETIYYRMKTATAVADTALIHFRYHAH